MALCVEQVFGVQQHHKSRNWFGEVAVGCKGEVLVHSAKPGSSSLWPVLLKNLVLFGETLCEAVSEQCFCFADDMMIWLYWCITGISVLLVGSVITAVLCMTKKRAGETHRKKKNPMLKNISSSFCTCSYFSFVPCCSDALPLR